MKLYKLAISAVCLSLLTCTQTTSLNKNISNEYSIYLTGRVLDNDGKPVANAVAKLVNRNLSDTTSTDGCYYIMEKQATGMSKTMSAGDTLKILKAGQVITRLDIEKWIDTLPDVFIVQRDIYGNLSSPPSSLSKITATITGDSIPDSLSEIAELGYISATQKYSGFVYFVYTAQTLHYNVYVSVYSADSVLIGRSVSVGFPSTAGDIDMPTFDPNNVTPSVYAGNDTIVHINDTIRLHAVASNLYGLSIIKWEWSINGGSFVQTSTGDTNIIAPPDSNPQYTCAVRVTRSDNKIMTSSMKVRVYNNVPSVPVLTAPPDAAINVAIPPALTWGTVIGTTRYRVQVSTVSTFATTVADDSTLTAGTKAITGLANSTAYYWRVNAKNADGASPWSIVDSFTTAPPPITDIEGNVYHTITLGTQTWTVENLKTTKYNDGTPIPLVTNNIAWYSLTTPGYCWYNNDSATYKTTYGALYNWYTVHTGKLAPIGWHVPTAAEWNTLSMYLGGDSVSGGKLKESGTTHWNSYNIGSTNETGFSALPGGYRYYDGSFMLVGDFGGWWTASENNALCAYSRYLFSNQYSLSSSVYIKSCGFSVRLVRN